jgi:hypothetical protein
MIVRGFKSVIWVATVGGAALSCYMVSLQVATERAELSKVERQIIAAKRDIRSLQTELGTRGRLSQLEHWNAEVLALSAPSSAQFLSDGVKLARFEQRDTTIEERSADVRMAALSTDDAPVAAPAKPVLVQAVAPAPAPTAPVVHRASFTPGAAPQLAVSTAKAKPAAPAVAKGAAKAEPKMATKPAADAKPKAETKGAPAKADAKAVSTKGETRIAAKAPDAKLRTSRIDGKLVSEIKSGLRKGAGSGDN